MRDASGREFAGLHFAKQTQSGSGFASVFAGQSSEKLLAKTPPHYLADAGVDEENN
jgi:hypothetical protein